MTDSKLDGGDVVKRQDPARTFGRFDDEAREYVITDPRTPWPWINYLGADGLVGLISNTGGGYCFFEDAKLRRLTRYRYNAVPSDQLGRCLYIKDGDTVWSPGWKPAQTDLDEYSCRHGLGYTVITGAKGGVEAEVLSFIPLGESVEVQRIRLRNRGRRARKIRLFTYVEWCLWNAEDDATNFQRNFSTGEVVVDGSTLFHVTEYRERRDHFAFYSVDRPLVGFDTDREAFVGAYGDLRMPEVVRQGAPSNSRAHGWAPIASHCVELELQPGGEEKVVALLGYVVNPEDEKWDEAGRINTRRARAVIGRLGHSEGVDRAFARLREHWNGVLEGWRVESPEPKLDRLSSIWNPYQCSVTFAVSRSASLFESGVSRGMGFRDSNQDLLSAVQIMPARARQRLLDLAATQMSDGSAYHQYQPLTKKGNAAIGSGFNDDPLWLIASTAAFIKETGDIAVLDENVAYDDAPDSDATLFDHLAASFGHVLSHRGEHGLPLIGRADWNDCLNLNVFSKDPDESFQTAPLATSGRAESLMIAGLFGWTGRDFVELCRRTGRTDEAEAATTALEAMNGAVHEHGWDGAWFLRAYTHDGQKVGSSENAEGQIFVEPQAWCVMAGIGLENGRAERALDSVQALLGSDHGVALVYPPYTRYQLALGEITSYPPGYKENGGVFCHTNPWVVIAETMLGRGERAFEVFKKTAPTYRQHLTELHRLEPYVYPQMIAGPQSKKPGEAKNSWLSGTASWAHVAASQYIFGIRPDYDGLRMDPCIPRRWPSFTVRRAFRGAEYLIEVVNPNHVSKGVRRVELNGEAVNGAVVPPQSAGSSNRVRVLMGEE
jgi:cellobiose phosphorylase